VRKAVQVTVARGKGKKKSGCERKLFKFEQPGLSHQSVVGTGSPYDLQQTAHRGLLQIAN
jgi:hypothetical protein